MTIIKNGYELNVLRSIKSPVESELHKSLFKLLFRFISFIYLSLFNEFYSGNFTFPSVVKIFSTPS